MNEIYLIVGNDPFLIDKEKENIIKMKMVDSFNVSSYDFADTDPLEILNEMTTISLLGEARIVIIKEPEFLKASYKNINIINKFSGYFEQDYSDTITIIITEEELDKKVLIKSILLKKATVVNVANITGDDLNTWVKNDFNKDGYNIEDSAVLELIERTEGDIMTLNNEIEKIKLYQTDKEVSYQTVKLLVSKNLEDNIFNLLNAFVSSDKKALLSIYEDFMAMNEDEMRIISAIMNKLEEILYTKVLINRRMGKDEVAAYFKVKPGRAYYMIQTAKKISDDGVRDLINRITKLDYEIKSGKIDKKLGLQLFMLGA